VQGPGEPSAEGALRPPAGTCRHAGLLDCWTCCWFLLGSDGSRTAVSLLGRLSLDVSDADFPAGLNPCSRAAPMTSEPSSIQVAEAMDSRVLSVRRSTPCRRRLQLLASRHQWSAGGGFDSGVLIGELSEQE